MASQSLKFLTDSLGEGFIRYILCIPEDVEISEGITSKNTDALEALTASVSQILSEQGEGIGFRLYATIHFGRFHPNLGTSWANHLHVQCGGHIDEVSEIDDPVLLSMRNLARDIWPTLLIKAPEGESGTFWMTTASVMHGNPHALNACKELMDDDDLSLLFPRPSQASENNSSSTDLLNIQADWMMNTGQGGSRYLITTLDSIIFYAVARCRIQKGSVTQSSVMQALEVSVRDFRKLATKTPVDVPALIGFVGVQLSESDQSLSLSSGVLRNVRTADRDFLSGGSQKVSSVYETTFPVQILKISPHAPDEVPIHNDWDELSARVEETNREFQNRVDQMRLSLLLASENNEHLATHEASRYIMDPLQFGGLASWSSDQRHLTVRTISDQQVEESANWNNLIHERHPAKLNIAMKRLLSAVSQRLDPSDAFIDAIICWENIFGSKGETTFRVTSAIAKLIGPEGIDGRISMQRKLENIYSMRSDLVHGADEISMSEAWKQKEEAVDISLNLLRILYKEMPELLNMKPSNRGKKILLEG